MGAPSIKFQDNQSQVIVLKDTDEIDACSPPRHDWLDGSDADLRDSMHSPDNG